MRPIVLTVLLLVGLPFAGSAQSAPTKQEDIRQLVAVTGTIDLMKQSMQRMMGQFRQTMTQIPEAFWTELDKEIDYNELLNKLLPVYDAHYTHDDIKALLAFYRSPIGQKSIRELPAIMQESSAIGRAWGEAAGRRVAEKIQRAQADSTAH
ncbi:hypothetical protein GCM10027578_20210 [Spirosoma luteolum]|jgi:hypothetical protein